MNKEYPFPGKKLQSYIADTIRFYNEYALDKTKYSNNTYKIKIGPRARFLQYQVFEQPPGSKLSIFAGQSIGNKIAEDKALSEINLFFECLDKVINKDVQITSDFANRDVYKSGQTAVGILTLVKLIVAIGAIIFALSILMR